MDTDSATDTAIEHLQKQGYVVLKGLLSPAELKQHLARLEDVLAEFPRGRNVFEGERTQRVYSLLAYDKLFADIAEHPAVTAILDQLLMAPYLLSTSQVIVIHKDETPQPLHADGAFYRVPRPHTPMSYSTIWALDDFTTKNGATDIIPGSHLWDDARTDAIASGLDLRDNTTAGEDLLEPVCMPAGSCVLFAGTLLHRGGRNHTDTPRRAYTCQYCQPWVRPIENFYLSIPRDKAAQMSERVQSMLGYDVLPPFIGQMAGRHPRRVLNPEFRNPLDDI